MSDVAIRVDKLGKQYRIGKSQAGYQTFRESISGALVAPLRRLQRIGKPNTQPETIWALKDVSFEIKRGEVVGIIGRNGAGKSTLLKILSRVTEPTEGCADIYGRVGSLLEVGTGFHPELTGRENIYLNGAILGMKRADIVRKFDEIVAFAEIEKFVDTPVKHYSSGMYLRLAFAVAAHLEPEILLVDEVLAVGDAAFQKKCLGKMGEVAREGRTVLFVSHNMAAIEALCPITFLVDHGTIVASGATAAVITKYMDITSSLSITETLENRVDRQGDGSIRVTSISIEDTEGKTIHCASRLRIRLSYKSDKPIYRASILIGIYDLRNTGIYLLDSDAVGGLPEAMPQTGTLVCTTAPINLTPGRCYVNVAISKGPIWADYVQYAAFFDVESEAFFASGKVPPRSWVTCLLRYEWILDDKGSINAPNQN
ncbi:MAG: ABC transporter ATP-binding protein [Nitrospirae bacterium]|nr:ABC transporter ATP-binding protein [Nitrospirota bacterium]